MEKKHKSGGMPYFEKDHWQKNVEDVMYSKEKYGTDFGAEAEYKRSVDAGQKYIAKHRPKK